MTAHVLPSLARRKFFAFVGGITLTGAVERKADATQPTLVPTDAVPPQLPVMADLKHPLLSACGTETCALVKIRENMPQDEFRDFLEGGLRVAGLFNGRSEAEIDRLLRMGIPINLVRGDWS